MKRHTVLILSSTFLVVACATTKTLQAVGGSRADGTVKLAFEYGMLEKPQVDTVAALQTARARCNAWGYSDAEAFGAAMTQCVSTGSYGCLRTMVTVEYQCTSASSHVTGPDPITTQPSVPNAPPATLRVSRTDRPGTIDLGGGVMLVPAKTLSGYCIKAPPGYMGAGSVNRPAITIARPLCS